jgi:H+/Cl- antiporter ClcA
MGASQDIRRLESELETHTSALREDAAQISSKIDEIKAQLSSTNFVRERAMLVLGTALLLGFALGYLLGRHKVTVEAAAQPAVEHLGKPIARRLLATAGKAHKSIGVH